MINVSPTVTTNLTMLIYNIEGGGGNDYRESNCNY